MLKSIHRNIILLLIVINGLSCRQPYNPPVAKMNLGYLVVDGTIISGNDSTIINLSRTQNITDSNYVSNPETGAVVNVVGASGDMYGLTEQSSGRYVISQLNLNNNEFYRLSIVTSNGNQYLSDSMPVLLTPPIDSVSWQLQNDGAHIYVNTHDAINDTRFYRWQYTESWEYQSPRGSNLVYDAQDTMVIERMDTGLYNYSCWQTFQSTNLLLGTSEKLSENVIYEQPIILIPSGSQKLSVEYSILVNQYALSATSYAFWQLLQQSTEQLGSLFDPQPSQLTGNIHNVANSNEPVLGYISACTLQQQRIFILAPKNWVYAFPGCDPIIVGNTPDSLALEYGMGYLLPYYALIYQNQIIAYYSAPPICVDCTLQGGTLTKPPFWP
jgi:hypothetical protein